MRQGQQNKRPRGRNRKGPNPLARSYESNGPDVKIRGTALHIAEKYVMLARDAQTSGDRVAAESYLQHAEHYYRIVAAAQAQMPQQPQTAFRTDDDDEGDEEGNEFGFDRPREQGPGDRPREFNSDRGRDYQGDRPREYQGDRPREYQGDRPREYQGDRPREYQGDRPRDFQPRERRDFGGGDRSPDQNSQAVPPAGGAPDAQPYTNGNGARPVVPGTNGAMSEGDQPQYFSEDGAPPADAFRARRRRPNRGRGRRPEGEGQSFGGAAPVSGDDSGPGPMAGPMEMPPADD